VQLDEARIALVRGKRAAGPSPARQLWSDPVAAALTGIRAALAVAITTALWFATAWPNGPIAVIVAGVVCTLIASMEQPEKITLGLAATILVAAVPVYVTQFHLLPYALDFVSMAVVLAPLLLGCAFIIAQPGIGPLGLLAAVYFAVASHIDNNNAMTYNVVNFLNTSLAIFIGIGAALVMFAVFFPETPERTGGRFRRYLSVQLSRLAAARRPSVQAFDFALCESLVTTLAHVKDEPALARECLESEAIALSSGHAISRLRTAISADRLAPGIAAGVSSLLGRISRAYLHPSRASLLGSAWEARTLRHRSLATARAVKDPEQIDALADVLVSCEVLRSGLVQALIHLREMSDVR
jgi:uncharacterized membrane protein YccC